MKTIDHEELNRSIHVAQTHTYKRRYATLLLWLAITTIFVQYNNIMKKP